jgi:hypothetical protein
MSKPLLYVCEISRPTIPEPPAGDLEAAAQRFFRGWSSAENTSGAFAVARMLKHYGGWRLDGPSLGRSVVIWTLYRLWERGFIETAAPEDLQTELQSGSIDWEADNKVHHAPVALESTCFRVMDYGWEWWRSGCELLSEADSLTTPAKRQRSTEHSDDFRSVKWYSVPYSFTALQAACVRVLWENDERGTPEVGEQTILEAAESQQNRLDHVFDKGKHAAWGTMIVPGKTKGSFRLNHGIAIL